MAQANDGVAVTAGVGTTIATQLVNGKEYQAVMLAGPTGHVEGTLDTYLLSVPPQAVGASKLHLDLFNGSAANIIKVRGAWVVPAQDVAVTGLVAVRLDWFRTSAVGTAGTAATYNSATIGPNISPRDSNNAALPAGVTARAAPTAGATAACYWFPTYHQTEETSVAAAYSQYGNVFPDPDRSEQEMILRPSQGLLAKQGTVAGVGSIGFLIAFTVE
jgi:hypothetical protein